MVSEKKILKRSDCFPLSKSMETIDPQGVARFDWGLIGRIYVGSDFIWNFRKLPFPSHLGKHFTKIGKISAKMHEIGKIKAIFRLGMTPI